MLNTGSELTVLQGVAQFVSYAVLAVFAENVVFSRALGVSRLLKLVSDGEVKTWQFCLPILAVQLFSAPLGWLAHTRLFPFLRGHLPPWLPTQALRPLVYLGCAFLATAAVWALLQLPPRRKAAPYLAQLPLAAVNCSVLGTLLVCANQNYTLLQTVAFGLGSGVGYLFAVFAVDEGRRRLLSKDIPVIFKGLPSALIYMGILALAIYGLVGHSVVI